MRAYKKLHTVAKEGKLLSSTLQLLDWDQETYMPPGGATFRGQQTELMARLTHEHHTGKTFTEALSAVVDLKSGKVKGKLSEEQQAAVREWRRDYLKGKKLPTSFVEKFAGLTSEAKHVWAKARKEDNFVLFAPYLKKIVEMCRKKADLLGYTAHPYDALLDEFEPNMTTARIDKLFGELRKRLVAFLKPILKAKPIDDSFLRTHYPQETQLDFSWKVLDALGYSRHHGRLDLSTHPFSIGLHPTDSRITTRIDVNDVTSNILIVLHEAGHALYEMGLPIEHFGSPLAEAISLGIHESQSLFWEKCIGHGAPLWRYFFPLLQKAFKPRLDKVSFEAFYAALNKVTPSFIRVEADEVTYPLHVILRFELEKALIEGSLDVKELPEAWNSKMKASLGITPKTNREGCLQDIHWSMGALGYFPTYTLGMLYATQLFGTFQKQHRGWEKRVAKGELLFIRKWLQKKIHCHGKRYPAEELITEITGKGLGVEAYFTYLNSKYPEIYGL